VVALDGDGGDLGFQPPAPGLGTLERRRELLRLVFGPRQLRTERLELCARIVDFWVECCVRIGSLLFKNKKIGKKDTVYLPLAVSALVPPPPPEASLALSWSISPRRAATIASVAGSRLTTGLFLIRRARSAYLRVLSVSSKLFRSAW
jgi:hypothetical protein